MASIMYFAITTALPYFFTQQPMTSKKQPKYIFVAVLMLLLFNFPLLSAANKKLNAAGVPMLCIYIAIVWLAGILLLYLTSTAGEKPNRKEHE